MADITIELNTTKLDQLINLLLPRTQAVVSDAANDLKDDVRANWSGHFPPASQAGEAPAIRSGDLDASVTVVPQQELSTGKVQNVLTVTAPYASYLEYGTLHMSARPYLRPAVMRQQQYYGARFKAIFSV